MTRFILSGIFFLTVLLSNAQQLVFAPDDSLAGAYTAFAVDNFGRVSVVKKDVIKSYWTKLDTASYTTSLKSFRPTSIESSKSFRTLVFDQERSVIHFLDNTLTDIHGEIDLVNLDIQQPWLVCESFGGNAIWIFDAGSMRLIKMNENLDKLLITENLATVFNNGQLPVKMLEAHDRLFALVPDLGVTVFDVFGTYMTTYPCKAKTFDVFNNYLLIAEDNKLKAIPLALDGAAEQEFSLPTGVIQFKFTAEKVYFLTEQGLFVGKYITKE